MVAPGPGGRGHPRRVESMRVLGHLPRTPTGGSVDYATNEVRHFRTCPSGGDLIVAHDIAIDTSKTPYFTSGGVWCIS
jgi:hypothetical protein